MDRDKLPTEPPALSDRVELSEQQIEQAEEILSELSLALESFPVVLSQQGDALAYAGLIDEKGAERVAKLVDRVWLEGQDRLARELIRFEEEPIAPDEESEHVNLMIYSLHVSGAMTLSIGWQMSISLTQLRAEASDAVAALTHILNP